MTDFPFLALLAGMMVAATPILLAGIGEMVVERTGVLNLGVEGMMIVGAICGFAVGYETQSAVLGYAGAALGGAALAMIFGVLTQFLMTNQVATGLALTLTGLGIASLIGQPYVGLRGLNIGDLNLGPLSDIPILGTVLFRHDAMVYVSIAIVAGVWATLRFTRLGLVLRAVGENHTAAHSLGYKVVLLRLGAIAFGGACAGLGGAYLSLVRVPQWTEGMTAGAGWIALALVVFSSWRAWGVLVGAYLFGGLTALQLFLQARGVGIPVEYLSMSPYILTIVVLVIMSSGRARATLAAPACLGQPFNPKT